MIGGTAPHLVQRLTYHRVIGRDKPVYVLGLGCDHCFCSCRPRVYRDLSADLPLLYDSRTTNGRPDYKVEGLTFIQGEK